MSADANIGFKYPGKRKIYAKGKLRMAKSKYPGLRKFYASGHEIYFLLRKIYHPDRKQHVVSQNTPMVIFAIFWVKFM